MFSIIFVSPFGGGGGGLTGGASTISKGNNVGFHQDDGTGGTFANGAGNGFAGGNGDDGYTKVVNRN